jgi:diguanylate cyclase (GGDEF)-like protein
MSGASFILAINLVVAGLFAVAFFLVAANNRVDRVAVWFGIAYLGGVGYFVFEFLLPLQTDPKIAGYLAFASFFGATITLTIGISRRYRIPLPRPLMIGTIVGCLVVNWFAFDLPRDSFLRMLLYQAPYAIMQAACVGIVLQSKKRGPMDLALTGLFTLGALQFLSKPFAAGLTGGVGASAQQYIGTNYALYSQSAGAVLSVATGLLMLMLLVRDMLMDVTARSEIDPLSGLYNRRGFEDRAEPGLLATGRGGVPAALVAIDLDHFKAVNDTYGHEAGDNVIRAFAALLSSAAPARAICARMGGEEFAVFLPGANLAAARLFAESTRSAFAHLPVEGLPEDVRFSASFGVAESSGTDSLSNLRRRADGALYGAKKAGRDKVTLAVETSLDEMPSHPMLAQPPKRTRAIFH